MENNFDSIYELYFNRVFRLCKGYFNGDVDLASDATQEVFIKVWEKLADFRNESGIGTWIYRIAANTCLMYLRKQSRKKEVRVLEFPEMISENPSNLIEIRLAKMYQCINSLTPTNRLIIMMVLEDLPYREIALVIGITEENLRVRIHRIKAILNKCVQHG